MVLRKIKERIKTLMPKRAKKVKASGKTRTSSVRDLRGKKTAATAAVAHETKNQTPFGAQETAIGKSKFSTPQAVQEPRKLIEDIPWSCGKDKIVLQVRDPWWLHTYWEVLGSTLDKLRAELAGAFNGAKMVLRVYDVSHVTFNGSNAHKFFDVEVGFQANSWYIDAGGPGRSWVVDIGLLLAEGRFITIARSNVVYTPLEGPSWITDEEWMIPEEMFARLYGMGFGFGKSSPVGKAWQERMRKALFSGILASPGMASMSSPGKKIPQRKFWFWVNTELIVYGATEPDAKVTVQGNEIQLRPDGTFSLRFALPDGKQVIPCTAQSADKVEERTITPIVTRETK